MPGPSTRLVRAVVAALALLLAGCAPPAGGSAPIAPAASSSPAPTPGSTAEAACGTTAPAEVTVEDLTIAAPDGVTLNAAAMGSGPQGVVLLHQTDNGLCGWLPYAFRLAGQGFSVLAFDQRCTFGSSCVEGEQQYNLIGACAEVAVDQCAALSTAVFDRKLGGGVTAGTAIGKVRRPLLYAVAPDDPSSPLAVGRALVKRARPGVVTFVGLPAGAGHGWETVTEPDDPNAPSAFATRLETFLRGER